MEGRKSLKVEGSVEGEKLRVEAPGGGGYSYILAIRVSAAGKGMVFKPFSLV